MGEKREPFPGSCVAFDIFQFIVPFSRSVHLMLALLSLRYFLISWRFTKYEAFILIRRSIG